MPADPGANLGKQKLPTQEKDIGHVAASFEKPEFYNSLLIRPEYRISLELGDIENLFLHSPKTKRGRMERMQVLGLFYFPLYHKRAETAFDGEPGAMGTWEYYKTKILGVDKNDDDAADEDIKTRLKKWVIQQLDGTEAGNCYIGDGTQGGGTLPVPAELDDAGKPKPDVTKGNFAKLRVPGGYGYIYDYNPVNFNHDDKYPLSMDPDNLYNAQEWCCQDNPVLGAIPLVAKVEKRDPSDGEWKPLKDAMVYFQLVKPYDLPAFNDKISPSAQINRPAMRESDMQTNTNSGKGPAKQDKKSIEYDASGDDDPQVDNCHKKYGGKRKLAVAENLFELQMEHTSRKDRAASPPVAVSKKDRPGFYAEHADDTRKSEVTAVLLEKPKKADPESDHPNAVQAKTNEKGYAGVIFKPSLAGGDRYRIRAYVGPDTLKGPGSTGTGMNAISVETGTLVVWRNLRISQILQKPYATIKQELVDSVKSHFNGVDPEIPLLKETAKYFKYTTGMSTQDSAGNFLEKGGYGGTLTDVGFGTLDFSRGRTKDGGTDFKYDGFILEVARSFCEIDFDEKGGNWFDDPPEGSDDWEDKWTSALASTKAYLKGSNARRTVRYTDSTGSPKSVRIDIDKLFDSTIAFDDGFFLLPIKMPKAYNSSAAPANRFPMKNSFYLDDNFKRSLNSWMGTHVVRYFLGWLGGRGFLPGFTIVQSPWNSVLHLLILGSDASIGMGFRCCVLILGKDNYPTTQRQWRDGTGKLQIKRKNNTKKFMDTFSYTSLLLHELGHCFFHCHAPPDPIEPTDTNYADSVKMHDLEADGFCVMTYLPCEGDFCGRCAFVLRGWKEIRNLERP